ncbi:hypothetical protein [Sphingomonas crocodyli]|uniref:Uncharacterized protein n=1 Tax=Sphingomonas crocodyli TaxID=1979270 RepID=A0A437LY94_9SPHN|nr:hypothetical protein [Sphingomonas crocodyli]RVT90335.1 hypothetical protein EOD43_18890 [Sphingomonas crocodyli]
MFQTDLFAGHADRNDALGLPGLIERIAGVSQRPRYSLMVLHLIAQAADARGRAGPYVLEDDRRVPIRDWLCDALVPMAQRDARRLAIVAQVRAELENAGRLPADAVEGDRLVDAEVRLRVLKAGRCNVSRAVSDLVQAGLVRRHYQGERVDHHNRGAQREAVYTITESARPALRLG